MANARSDLIAAIYAAQPQAKLDLSRARGRLRVMAGTVTVDTTASKIYPLARFKATDHLWYGARISDSPGVSSPAADVGLYAAGDWTVADQAALDVDLFQAAFAIGTSGAKSISTIFPFTTGLNVPTGTTGFKALWEFLGSTPPAAGTEYDLCLTTTTVPASAFAIAFWFFYTAGIGD